MALDTINIPNTVGATLRTNINDALEASATAFSGSDTPTTGNTGLNSLIGVLWYDTSSTPSVLKVGTETGGTFVVVTTAVQDNLESDSTTDALSAVQGKTLKTELTTLGSTVITTRATTGSDAALFKFTFVGGVLNIKPTT